MTLTLQALNGTNYTSLEPDSNTCANLVCNIICPTRLNTNTTDSVHVCTIYNYTFHDLHSVKFEVCLCVSVIGGGRFCLSNYRQRTCQNWEKFTIRRKGTERRLTSQFM